MPDVDYEKADEVKEIAKKIIFQYHPHLEGAKITYLFRDKAIKTGGKTILGKATKCTPANRLLHEQDFFITIAKDVWEVLTKEQKEALVDHELSHCGTNKFGNWSLLPHDCEEFISIIERHGDHAVSVKKLLIALNQSSGKSSSNVQD